MPVYLRITVSEKCTFYGFGRKPSYLRPLRHVRHETYFSRSQIMDGNCLYCCKLCVNTELITCHFNHTVTNLLELSCDQLNNVHGYITGGHDPFKKLLPAKSCGLLLSEQKKKIVTTSILILTHAMSKFQVKLCDYNLPAEIVGSNPTRGMDVFLL